MVDYAEYHTKWRVNFYGIDEQRAEAIANLVESKYGTETYVSLPDLFMDGYLSEDAVASLARVLATVNVTDDEARATVELFEHNIADWYTSRVDTLPMAQESERHRDAFGRCAGRGALLGVSGWMRTAEGVMVCDVSEREDAGPSWPFELWDSERTDAETIIKDVLAKGWADKGRAHHPHDTLAFGLDDYTTAALDRVLAQARLTDETKDTVQYLRSAIAEWFAWRGPVNEDD